jgi:hypothetical protein
MQAYGGLGVHSMQKSYIHIHTAALMVVLVIALLLLARLLPPGAVDPG